MWHLPRRWLAVLIGASLLAGCGEDAAEDVQVAVERSRLFEQQRSLGVTVRNAGPEAAVVDDVRFDAGPYEAVPAADRTVTVPAGGQVTFPVPYGVARCGDGEQDLVVRFALAGSPTSTQVPVSDQVRRAHERECAAAAVREAVDITFGDDWRLVAPREAQGSLEVVPRGAEDVTVLDVTTSIVFVTTVRDEASGGGAVPLDVVAGRCDVHALIESKRTFTFTVSVAVDDAEPVALEVVPPDGPAKDVLQQAIEGCLTDEAGA